MLRVERGEHLVGGDAVVERVDEADEERSPPTRSYIVGPLAIDGNGTVGRGMPR